MSRKPNPAIFAEDHWHPERARQDRDFLESPGLPRRADHEGHLHRPLPAATAVGMGPDRRCHTQQIHDYAWPDPGWQDVSQIRAEAQAWQRQYALLGGDWSPFWHDAIDLLGMENLYLKMYDAPDLVDAVLRHIVDYYAAVSQRIFDAAADTLDVFFIGNDFGSQNGPLLSPAQFDRFMLPHLQRLIDLGHAYRLKVQLHCCGGFEPLMPAMIAAGLDGLHAIQPSHLHADPTTSLWFDKPATRFQQSLPLGNGRIGAMVFGGVDEERIVLNESSVWSGSPEDADRPDAHQALPEIRRLLLEGKNVEAEKTGQRPFHLPGQRVRARTGSERAVRLLSDARQPATEVQRRSGQSRSCSAIGASSI
jgi:hypothetical protein